MTRNLAGHNLLDLRKLPAESYGVGVYRMRQVANDCRLLSVASFAGPTFLHFKKSRRLIVSSLYGVSILALAFSALSPEDDLLQQELIRPAPSSASIFVHTRVVPRRAQPACSISRAVTACPIPVIRTWRSRVVGQHLLSEMYLAASLLTHSPPKFTHDRVSISTV